MADAQEVPLTRTQYDSLTPQAQGYLTYMRADHPGWDIPKANPFPRGSDKAKAWDKGNARAVQDVQDGEE